MSLSPPQDYESLIAAITQQHGSLSKRLREIANFALEHPTTMGIETIANIARNANVQPSALIRFAKTFGFGGFSEMQRLFQRYVTEQSESYKERIARELAEHNQSDPGSLHVLFKQFCEANVVALGHLQQGIDAHAIDKAVTVLRQAAQIYIVGQRRSLPIASYLTYTLSRADCRVHLIDGRGGMLREQIAAMSASDALIAITYHPYSADTGQVVDAALEKKVPCIAISDSSVSPIVDKATVAFTVHEAEVFNFRSLSASMLLAQTLATGVVFDEKKAALNR